MFLFIIHLQVSSHEFSLDIGEDRILIESLKHGIVFDKFVSYRLNQERAQALFDKTSKVGSLQIAIINKITNLYMFSLFFRCSKFAFLFLVLNLHSTIDVKLYINLLICFIKKIGQMFSKQLKL